MVQSPRHNSRMVQAILGNWQGSAVFTASSGSWLNVSGGEDASLTNVGADRPIEISNPFTAGAVASNPNTKCQSTTASGGIAPTAVHTLLHWYNPCAFVMAPLGSYGTLGRDSMLGPGNWNFDAAIWRTFPISERFKLDFRAEAFNALNHLQIANPGTGIFTGNISVANPNGATGRSNTAGYIGSAANQPRIMQLALKLTF